MRSINLGSASNRSIADDAAELAAIVLLIDNHATITRRLLEEHTVEASVSTWRNNGVPYISLCADEWVDTLDDETLHYTCDLCDNSDIHDIITHMRENHMD